MAAHIAIMNTIRAKLRVCLFRSHVEEDIFLGEGVRHARDTICHADAPLAEYGTRAVRHSITVYKPAVKQIRGSAGSHYNHIGAPRNGRIADHGQAVL